MVLPTEGRLSFSEIAEEFDDDFPANYPYALSQFYAAGKYVPAGQFNGAGEPIPTSGTLKLSDFYGAAKISDEQVRNLRVTARTLTSLSFAWDPPVTPDVGYRFQLRLYAPDGTYQVVGNPPSSQRPTTWTANGLTPDTEYQFWIQAQFLSPFRRGPFVSITVKTLALVIPAPSNLRFDQITETTARARWDAPTGVPAGLTFVRYEGAIAISGEAFGTDASTTSASMNLTGLTPGTAYDARMLAVFRTAAAAEVKSAYITASFTTESEDCTEWTPNGEPTTEYGDWSDWSAWTPNPCVQGETQTRSRQRTVTRLIPEKRTCDGNDEQTRIRRDAQAPEIDPQNKPCEDVTGCECEEWVTDRTENEVSTSDGPVTWGEWSEWSGWTPPVCLASTGERFRTRSRSGTFVRTTTTQAYLVQSRTCTVTGEDRRACDGFAESRRVAAGNPVITTAMITTHDPDSQTDPCPAPPLCECEEWVTDRTENEVSTSDGPVTWNPWPTHCPSSGVQERTGTLLRTTTTQAYLVQSRTCTVTGEDRRACDGFAESRRVAVGNPVETSTRVAATPQTRCCCYIGGWGAAYIESRTLTPWQDVGPVVWGDWGDCIPGGEGSDEPNSGIVLGTQFRFGRVPQEATQVTVWRQDRTISSCCPAGTQTSRTSTEIKTASDPGHGFLSRTVTTSEDRTCIP